MCSRVLAVFNYAEHSYQENSSGSWSLVGDVSGNAAASVIYGAQSRERAAQTRAMRAR